MGYMAKAPANCPSTDADPWDPDILADPYELYRDLQDLGPVVWLSKYEVAAITHYDAVRQVLTDWETFSSAQGVGMDPAMNARHGGILTTDPPVHDPLRAVLNHQLMGHRLDPHHGFIERSAEDLVDELVVRGRFDAVAELAQPYSVKIVADLVGFPIEGRERLIERASGAFDTFGPANDQHRAGVDQLRDLFSYCAGLEHDQALTTEGWGAEIYAAGERGEIAPVDCKGLLLAYAWAGMDTTVNAIAMAVKLLAEHPDQWDQLRSQRELMGPAINEILRLEPPVHRFTRLTTTEVELAGVVLPAGTRAAVLFGAANRDPNHFDRPDEFDIARRAHNHLSFGRGVHRCVGAPLAQLEIEAVLNALADRVSTITVHEAKNRANNALHGLAHLDVSVTPAA